MVRGLGGPNLEGRRLLPRLGGEVGPGRCEPGRAIPDNAGDIALAAGGELGRASRDGAATDGLEGRGRPPGRDELVDGEAGRARPDVKRVTWEGGAGARLSCGSEELGPATLRRRSSSCVLSFGESGPTRVHIFSPTNKKISLSKYQ